MSATCSCHIGTSITSSVDFAIMAAEFGGEKLGRWTQFRARDGFRPSAAAPVDLPAGHLLAEGDFWVECTALDHATPSLAFALQESMRVNVWGEGMKDLGLAVGPWLNSAKTAVRRRAPDDTIVSAGDGREIPLGLLKERALHIAPGQRVVYVVDAAFHPANAERIIAIARGADHLYIEAAFLHADLPHAAARCHLTARQAGELARRAGARRLTTFHYSPRYLDRPDVLWLEAEQAFRGE